jgi:3-dehydroquinate synthase
MAATVEVSLGKRSYLIHIGGKLISQAGTYCRDLGLGGSCAVITDSHVAPLHAEPLLRSLATAGNRAELIVVPAGEPSKSLSQVQTICDRMIAARLDRSSFVIALGGGVVGDLAGFVAAVYYRGIPYIQMPTTIVAQVDSSVGGKTGVNAPGGKNLIGAFHQPRGVVADTDTLRTLPDREFNEGLAEAVKHAIIRDGALFQALENFNREELPALITRNVEIKAAIVGADERETTGERALLNFGHTIGHGIENAAGYGRYLHGEAISLGIVAACHLSMRKAGLSENDHARILRLLQQFKLPTKLAPEVSTGAIMTALRTDKKFAGGSVRFVLTGGIGSARLSGEVTLDEIQAAIEALR